MRSHPRVQSELEGTPAAAPAVHQFRAPGYAAPRYPIQRYNSPQFAPPPYGGPRQGNPYGGPRRASLRRPTPGQSATARRRARRIRTPRRASRPHNASSNKTRVNPAATATNPLCHPERSVLCHPERSAEGAQSKDAPQACHPERSVLCHPERSAEGAQSKDAPQSCSS